MLACYLTSGNPCLTCVIPGLSSHSWSATPPTLQLPRRFVRHTARGCSFRTTNQLWAVRRHIWNQLSCWRVSGKLPRCATLVLSHCHVSPPAAALPADDKKKHSTSRPFQPTPPLFPPPPHVHRLGPLQFRYVTGCIAAGPAPPLPWKWSMWFVTTDPTKWNDSNYRGENTHLFSMRSTAGVFRHAGCRAGENAGVLA